MAEYRARHAAVWPEMLEALSAAGWRNYSLFISPTGMLIGYLECDDFDAARRAMEETDVNARWQARDGASSSRISTAGGPTRACSLLDEVFHLD